MENYKLIIKNEKIENCKEFYDLINKSRSNKIEFNNCTFINISSIELDLSEYLFKFNDCTFKLINLIDSKIGKVEILNSKVKFIKLNNIRATELKFKDTLIHDFSLKDGEFKNLYFNDSFIRILEINNSNIYDFIIRYSDIDRLKLLGVKFTCFDISDTIIPKANLVDNSVEYLEINYCNITGDTNLKETGLFNEDSVKYIKGGNLSIKGLTYLTLDIGTIYYIEHLDKLMYKNKEIDINDLYCVIIKGDNKNNIKRFRQFYKEIPKDSERVKLMILIKLKFFILNLMED